MQTPCIHLCSLDPATGFCIGCGRTLQEIGNWMSYSDGERQQIIASLPARLPARPAALAGETSAVPEHRS
jgi:predicted Fe-S protein YdhL (DUF1289 family)